MPRHATSSPTAAIAAAPRVGASALLVLSLLLVASVDPWRSLGRESLRETSAERAVVRELAVTIAKAVRHLAGADHLKSAPRCAPAPAWDPMPAPAFAVVAPDVYAAPRDRALRAELLDLPPPAAA